MNTNKAFCLVNSNYDELHISQLEIIDSIANMGFPVFVTGKHLNDPVAYTEVGIGKDNMKPMYVLSKDTVVISSAKPNCFEIIPNLGDHISVADYQRYLSISNLGIWPLIYITDCYENGSCKIGWNTFANLKFSPHDVEVTISYNKNRNQSVGSLPKVVNRYRSATIVNGETIEMAPVLELDKKNLKPWTSFESEINQILHTKRI